MLPALLSFGLPICIIVISLFNANLGAIIVLVFIGITLLRAVRGGVDAIRGYCALRAAERADWAAMNEEIEGVLLAGRSALPLDGRPAAVHRGAIGRRHAAFLTDAAVARESYPLPSEVVHAIIVTAYNEPYEVVSSSIEALSESAIGADRLVVLLAYEERGGEQMRATAERLERDYGYRFRAFELVEHPADLPNEIPGKGANLTYAGRRLHEWLAEHGVDERLVVVTSLDCDNRPHPRYFDAVTYEFVRATDRERASFQPISLFVNNIWHAQAPMRIIAAGNSLWNLIATVRPFSLRNFASHAQPMAALVSMDYWSRRTIVEDGHQFWRSYFHFRGRYRVVPVRVPIYQDAVLTEKFSRTLKTQFTQLSRWAYGASDVPYVGVRVLSRRRVVPFWRSLLHFALLIESHVSLASIAPLVLIGAWIPLLVSKAVFWLQSILFPVTIHGHYGSALLSRRPGVPTGLVADLPGIVDFIQRLATPGLIITVVVTLLLLPARPREFGRGRSFGMIAQWLLLPLTAIGYNAAAAMLAQARLFLGRYRERFDVTEKAALESHDQALTGA